jgi:hypothetical protein
MFFLPKNINHSSHINKCTLYFRTNDGQTPLYVARRRERGVAVDILLAAGASEESAAQVEEGPLAAAAAAAGEAADAILNSQSTSSATG